MSTRPLTAYLLVVALLAGVFSVLAGGSPAAATVGPYSSWTMRSDWGDPLLQGDERYIDGSYITFEGDPTRIEGHAALWNVVLAAPPGEQLQVGRTYTGATKAASAKAGEPGLDVNGEGRSCNQLTGSFTVHELTFSLLGELESAVFTFEQHCEMVQPALYGSVAWQGSRPAPTLPPKFFARVAQRRVQYGGPATVEAYLSPDSNRELLIYGKEHGKPERLLRTAQVGDDGVAIVPVPVTETTTLIVRFDGHGQVPDQEMQRRVVVTGKVTSTLKGDPPRKGRYHLYRPSQNPLIRSVVEPNHRGDCLKFRAEFFVQGGWGYPAFVRCVRLDRRSSGTVRFIGDPRLVGIPIRVRAEWRGDERNYKSNGRWLYLKFVR